MNIDLVKEKIEKNIGKKVVVNVYGLRNKKMFYEGILRSCYSNVFVVDVLGSSKSFTYADVITGEVKLQYK